MSLDADAEPSPMRRPHRRSREAVVSRWRVALLVALSAVIVGGCGPSTPSGGSSTGSPTTVAAPTSPAGLAPSSLVDTFVGTGVGGKSVGSIDTFPGADMPFGMVQWSPDTTPDRTSGGGYSFKDSAISGFSLTHMSGPGCAVY